MGAFALYTSVIRARFFSSASAGVCAATSALREPFCQPPRVSRWRGVLSAGLLGVVHVGLRDPRYAGPCRDRLENTEAREAVRAEMVESFSAFLAEQPALEAMLLARIAS